MTPHWSQIEILLPEALALPASRRAAFLELHCADAPELRAELESLLAAADGPSALDEPLGLVGQPEPSAPSLETGERLGVWSILKPLGRGGMGEVWLARRADGLFDAPVALKLLHPHLLASSLRERFMREGRILGGLSHPNVARLLDAGVLPDGRLYLALEYVEGERIDRWCDARRLGVEARIRLFRQVCEAVAHAHAHLVVHRDLKPSNILVSGDGTIKLLDFGIAKLIERDDESVAETDLTRLGGRALTPEYAAPEQILGGPVSVATDVYTLGVLLYELLCGRRPYAIVGASATQIERAVLDTEVAAPSDARPRAEAAGMTQQLASLRGDLDTIVLKALKKAPAERYASVQDLSEDLGRYLDHRPVLARPDSTAYRLRKYWQRNRIAVVAAGAVLLLLVAGIAGVAWQAHSARLAERAERAQRNLAETREARLREVVGFQGAMLDRVNVPAFGRDFYRRFGERLDRRAAAGDAPELPDRTSLRALQAKLAPYADLTDIARETLVSDLLAPAETEMAQRFGSQPDVLAALYDSLADSYRALRLWPEAERLLAQAAALHEEEGQSGALAALESHAKHAQTLAQLDRAVDALKEAQEVAAARARLLGAQHPETLRARGTVAGVLKLQGRFAEAQAIEEDELAQQRAQLGPDHADTLITLVNLGVTYLDQSRPLDALRCFEAAMPGLSQRFGPIHEATISARNNLALALTDGGRPADAKAVLIALIADLRAAYGEDDPHTVDSQGNLADVLVQLGEVDAAMSLDRQNIASLERLRGPDDLDLLRMRANYAEEQREHGELPAALAVLEDVVARRRRLQGSGHPQTLYTLNQLAVSLRLRGSRGDLERARGLGEQTAAGLAQAVGDSHQWTAEARESLSETCRQMGDRTCACGNGRAALDAYLKQDPAPAEKLRALRQQVADCPDAVAETGAKTPP